MNGTLQADIDRRALATGDPGPEDDLGQVRVLVIGRHRPSALGYFVVLSRQPFVERCLVTADRHEAVELTRQHRPEIAILELDWFTGSTVESLRASRPSLQFVMSARCDTAELGARQLGAAAIINVDATSSEIVDAVRAAVAQTSIARPIERSTDGPASKFNAREHSVLELLVTGATNQEIADALHLSLPSIKKYTSRIYRKLGVRNRVEVVRRIDELALADRSPAATVHA